MLATTWWCILMEYSMLATTWCIIMEYSMLATTWCILMENSMLATTWWYIGYPATSRRADQAVDWGLWNVVPLLFNGCAKSLDIGKTWNTLCYTSIQSIPNMLNGWHVWWVCRPWKNCAIVSFQVLCPDPCNMGLCIIMLKWHDNGPQGLVMVSLSVHS